MINPLICVLSPRDIPQVKEGHETFSYIPHLWIKYWRAIEAYHILTHFFKTNKQFTHLVISPDDLVVREEHYKSLSQSIQEHDFPVLSGVCNVDIAHPNMLAICKTVLPNIIRKHRKHYDYYNLAKEKQHTGIIRVMFSGMPFLFMRRDIVEQVPLEGDTKYDPTRQHIEPKSFDLAFAYECNQRNIPIFVDLGVKMLHLNGSGEYVLKVNTEVPKVYFNGEDLTNTYVKYIKEINPYNARDRLNQIVP